MSNTVNIWKDTDPAFPNGTLIECPDGTLCPLDREYSLDDVRKTYRIALMNGFIGSADYEKTKGELLASFTGELEELLTEEDDFHEV